MSDWMKGDNLPGRNAKRRKLSQDQERANVHRQIKGFFLQFKRSENYNDIRNKVIAFTSHRDSFMDVERSDVLSSTGSRLRSNTSSSQQKLEFLTQFRNTLAPNIAQIVEAMRGSDQLNQQQAIVQFSKMLSIVEIFPTPLQRRGVADEVIALFEFIYQNAIHADWVRLLNTTTSPSLQVKDSERKKETV